MRLVPRRPFGSSAEDRERLRIQLVVHHELDVNAGAPGATYRLAQAFDELGHEAEIYSFDDLPQSLGFRGKKVLFPLFVARLFARLQRDGGLDVFDASTADAWLLLLRPRRAHDTLLVTTSHGLEHRAHQERLESARHGILELSRRYPLYWGGLHLREVATSLRRADLALFLNQRDADYAVDQLGVARRRTRLVSNGIVKEFLNRPLEETPMGRDEPISIAQIASYLPQKGVAYSARVLSSILRRYPRVRVSLLGTGVAPDTVLADFDPELRERITVVQQYVLTDLPELLRGHQIKVLATVSEGFGTALIEAMACGLAPVTTWTAGPARIVDDGRTGLIVPPRDAAALERGLRTLIDDRQLLDGIRRRAWEVAQEYGLERVAAERVELYREFLRRKRASPQ